MKGTRYLNALAMLLVGMLLTTNVWAQQDKSKRPSPPATATGKVGNATVKVDYSSPAVKDRTVWGELVPYGKVWRAGANEATTVTFDKDVMVEGKKLTAGTYSLFTIPGEDQWTIIFNKQTGQWGTQYDEEQDALRVNVKPRKSSTMNDRLKYNVTNNGLVLLWENLEVPVAIKAS